MLSTDVAGIVLAVGALVGAGLAFIPPFGVGALLLRRPKHLELVLGAGHNQSLQPHVWEVIERWFEAQVMVS